MGCGVESEKKDVSNSVTNVFEIFKGLVAPKVKLPAALPRRSRAVCISSCGAKPSQNEAKTFSLPYSPMVYTEVLKTCLKCTLDYTEIYQKVGGKSMVQNGFIMKTLKR